MWKSLCHISAPAAEPDSSCSRMAVVMWGSLEQKIYLTILYPSIIAPL